MSTRKTKKAVTPKKPSLAFQKIMEGLQDAIEIVEKSPAFFEGYRASSTGWSKGRNPYEPGTKDYTDWQDGWEAKYYNEWKPA